jgi:hypothetical protein
MARECILLHQSSEIRSHIFDCLRSLYKQFTFPAADRIWQDEEKSILKPQMDADEHG